MQIDCPNQLDDIRAARFTNELWRARTEDELVINYSQLTFAYPSGVMISALGVRDIVKQRSQSGLKTHVIGYTATCDAISYLSYFGYFQFIGLEKGNSPNSVDGNARYLPITAIK